MVTATPKRVRLRTYQVGFGDCLLLTVFYDKRPGKRSERHVLIDFGSRAQRKGGPRMADIGAKIAEHCDGQLDVVVATHRHADHVKGFGDATASTILDGLHPALVVRPWTDVPDTAAGDPALNLDDASKDFISVLTAVGHQAEAVDQRFALDQSDVGERAKALASLGIPNSKAVARLEGWAGAGSAAWVRAGDELDVAKLLPGVRVQVLGPPTLEQVPDLRSYASASDQYWLALAATDGNNELIARPRPAELKRALKVLAEPGGVGAASWLLNDLHRLGDRQVLEIAEGFDDVLNNTSLILLVTIGKRSLLLSGDAQLENWSYSLDAVNGENGRPEDPALRKQLAGVDVYKVGHHGSRNATPRDLVKLWRSRKPAARPVTSVLSTKSGVYDQSKEGAVPKPELVEALEAKGPVYSTERLPNGVWWFDLEAPAAGTSSFQYTPGPSVT